MTGSSIFDYVHQSDHSELAEQLGVTLAHHQRLANSHNGNNNNGQSTSDSKGAHGQQSTGASPAIPDGKPCK